jgi:hypothetical protein
MEKPKSIVTLYEDISNVNINIMKTIIIDKEQSEDYERELRFGKYVIMNSIDDVKCIIRGIRKHSKRLPLALEEYMEISNDLGYIEMTTYLKSLLKENYKSDIIN